MNESLTLYSIETELLELLTLREELQSQQIAPRKIHERVSELEAIDNQIDAYLRKEIQKADGIAFMLQEFNRRADIAMDEANRQEDRSKMWEARHASLKSYVERIMQQMGKTKLEGEFNTLSLRKCPASVEIRQPELVPHEYEKVTITCSAATWVNLMSALLSRQPRDEFEDAELRKWLDKVTVSEPVPMKSWMKAELEVGSVPGCELVNDKVSLVVK